MNDDERLALADRLAQVIKIMLAAHHSDSKLMGIWPDDLRAVKDAEVALRLSASPAPGAEPVRLTYTNYRGETAERTITPKSIRYGATDWHPEPQWLLLAFDIDKQADREFALKDFCSPKGEPSQEWLDLATRVELGKLTSLTLCDDARSIELLTLTISPQQQGMIVAALRREDGDGRAGLRR